MALSRRRYGICWCAIGSASVLGIRRPVIFGRRRILAASAPAELWGLPFDRDEDSIGIISLFPSRGGGSEATVYDQEEKNDDEEEGDEEEEEEDDEEEEEDVDEEEDTDESSSNQQQQQNIPSDPVVLTIQTSSGIAVLDETMELETVVRTRTVRSIKESIGRKHPAKPPITTIQLCLDGRLLHDDEIIHDIVKEAHEEEEDETENASIVLTMETIPPVDPKFLPDLERKIPDLTSEELLQAYVTNEAALYQNSLSLESLHQPSKEEDDDDETQESATPFIRVNAAIRERAKRIRADLDATILSTNNAKTLLADEVSPRMRQQQPAQVEIRGQRIRTPSTTTSLRGIVQYNLNIDWNRTGRAIAVLVFFGLFGGRTALSKTILLLSAPLLILVQARSVKSALTQLLYTVLFHPPSIVLSLLPAPQQAILSISYEQAMKDIYADEIVGGKKPFEGTSEIDEDNEDEVVDTLEFEEEEEDYMDGEYDEEEEEEEEEKDDEGEEEEDYEDGDEDMDDSDEYD